MTYSNIRFRQNSGAVALFAVSLLLAGSLAGCSRDSEDALVPSKDQESQGAAKAEPTLRDAALPGGEGLAGDHRRLGGFNERRADVADDASGVLIAVEPVAVGVTLEPFGPTPGPGQVQWPGENTPAPVAAPTTSPF
jgi:hypothetical protein